MTKYYNELEQSWRKLKQDHPEVAKAIKESANIEYLFSSGDWVGIRDPAWVDNSIYRAPMQTEAEKFFEKWGGKKIWQEGMWRHTHYLVTGVLDHNRVYIKDKDGQHGNIVLRVSDNWQLWESPKPKRELKATDLIGWWAKDGNDYVGPLRVDASEGLIGVNAIGHKLENCDGWRFTKDPSAPLDQWQTLEEICGGES